MEQPNLNTPARKLLPVLAVASGWCGIAYELLYSRLLTTYLGDMFHVNAAILTSFLLGIGVGVGVGMLFAPAPGKDTRSTIAEQATNLKEKVRQTVRRESASSSDGA